MSEQLHDLISLLAHSDDLSSLGAQFDGDSSDLMHDTIEALPDVPTASLAELHVIARDQLAERWTALDGWHADVLRIEDKGVLSDEAWLYRLEAHASGLVQRGAFVRATAILLRLERALRDEIAKRPE